jgi:hypothetical protein
MCKVASGPDPNAMTWSIKANATHLNVVFVQHSKLFVAFLKKDVAMLSGFAIVVSSFDAVPLLFRRDT